MNNAEIFRESDICVNYKNGEYIVEKDRFGILNRTMTDKLLQYYMLISDEYSVALYIDDVLIASTKKGEDTLIRH